MDWLVFIAALVMVVAAVVAYQYCRSIKSIAATAPSFDAAPLIASASSAGGTGSCRRPESREGRLRRLFAAKRSTNSSSRRQESATRGSIWVILDEATTTQPVAARPGFSRPARMARMPGRALCPTPDIGTSFLVSAFPSGDAHRRCPSRPLLPAHHQMECLGAGVNRHRHWNVRASFCFFQAAPELAAQHPCDPTTPRERHRAGLFQLASKLDAREIGLPRHSNISLVRLSILSRHGALEQREAY
jgi:hypothetical protein